MAKQVAPFRADRLKQNGEVAMRALRDTRPGAVHFRSRRGQKSADMDRQAICGPAGLCEYTKFVILKIVQAGDPVLRQEARPLTADEIRSAACQQLIELMRQTMRDAPGVGLAAPQIGLALQLAVIEDREDLLKGMDPEALAERDRRPVPFTAIFNPVISLEGPAVEFFEGCLSLTGFSAIVPRASQVRVECLNHNAEPVVIEAAGWHARILQHEIDHLHGTLYFDRMLSRSLTTADNLARYWKDKPIAEVRHLLGCQVGDQC